VHSYSAISLLLVKVLVSNVFRLFYQSMYKERLVCLLSFLLNQQTEFQKLTTYIILRFTHLCTSTHSNIKLKTWF